VGAFSRNRNDAALIVEITTHARLYQGTLTVAATGDRVGDCFLLDMRVMLV